MRAFDLGAIAKIRDKVTPRIGLYHGRAARAYNKKVTRHIFKQGDVVLRALEHTRRQLPSLSKFSLNRHAFAILLILTIWHRVISV